MEKTTANWSLRDTVTVHGVTQVGPSVVRAVAPGGSDVN
jgi:hypothetical protein